MKTRATFYENKRGDYNPLCVMLKCWEYALYLKLPFFSYVHVHVCTARALPTQRCKMTAVNQDTGEIDKLGPLEILRGYRAPGGPLHARFGQLMIPLQAGGRVRVGDTVEVIERKRTGTPTTA